MKNLPDGLVMGCSVVLLLVASVVCFAITQIGEAVLPAEQVSVSGDPVQRIQPKGNDAQDDRNWMEGDKALDEGYAARTLADANAEKARAEAEEARANACATRNDCHSPTGTLAMDGIGLLIFGVICFIIGVYVVIQFLKALSGKGG